MLFNIVLTLLVLCPVADAASANCNCATEVDSPDAFDAVRIKRRILGNDGCLQLQSLRNQNAIERVSVVERGNNHGDRLIAVYSEQTVFATVLICETLRETLFGIFVK